MSFAVLLPVGPSSEDVSRAGHLLEGLYREEPAVRLIAVVDDCPSDRQLARRLPVPPDGELVACRNPRSRRASGTLGGLCTGVLAGLSTIASRGRDVAFVLRIDTDAVVIAAFAERVHDVLARDPCVGIAGSYDDGGGGTHRDWGQWESAVRAAAAGRPDRLVPWRRRQVLQRRALIARARENGYEWGENCLGAACFMSAAFLERAAEHRVLRAPRTWMHTQCGDDVMLGVLCRAFGLRFASLTGPGDVLAVSHVGLNDIPENMRPRGRAIVHSVRNDPRWSEAEIRRRLARETPAGK